MTGNLIIDTLISAVAIAVMVLVARFVFPAPRDGVTLAKARERLAFDEPDFRPRDWLIDQKGRAALVEGEGGDFALVRKLGLDLLTRRFRTGGASVEKDENGLTLNLHDPTLPKTVFVTTAADKWLLKFNAGDDI
ncbi:MAG: hypothetical protein ACX939_13515 [Hyphococcus sp.]